MLTNDERAAMIARATAEWGALQQLIVSFSEVKAEQPATCGSWSVRDVMVHIATWEEELLRIVRELDAGRQPAPTYTEDDGGIDAWNEAQVLRFKDAPLAVARRYFEETHAAVMHVLEVSDNIKPEWMAGMYGGGHREDLQTLRQRLEGAAKT